MANIIQRQIVQQTEILHSGTKSRQGASCLFRFSLFSLRLFIGCFCFICAVNTHVFSRKYNSNHGELAELFFRIFKTNFVCVCSLRKRSPQRPSSQRAACLSLFSLRKAKRPLRQRPQHQRRATARAKHRRNTRTEQTEPQRKQQPQQQRQAKTTSQRPSLFTKSSHNASARPSSLRCSSPPFSLRTRSSLRVFASCFALSPVCCVIRLDRNVVVTALPKIAEELNAQTLYACVGRVFGVCVCSFSVPHSLVCS